MLALYCNLCRDLASQIDDLKNEILQREHGMCAAEAKVFYEDLTSVHEKLIKYEIETKTSPSYSSGNYPGFLTNCRQTHLKATNLKIKLAKIFSSIESTPPTEITAGNQSGLTKESETEKNVDLQIRKQRSLIRRIESFEIHDDICAIKAEILSSQLSQLYDSFNLNQIQIEANIDDDDDDQIKIATEVQRKVIDFQTKLKKIMHSSTESNMNISIEPPIQPTQIDARVNSDSLFQKRQSLIKRISSLEPREDLCPEKAKVMLNHLNSLYKSFNSNETEIESRVSGDILDSQLETSEQIQNKVIELQAKFEKIVAPVKLSSSTQSEAQSEQIKSPEFESCLRSIELQLNNLNTELLESRSSRGRIESNINDICIHLEDDSELSKSIKNTMSYVQATLNKFVDANEQREKNALDKLDKILEFNERLEQDYKTKTLPSLSKSESNLRAIELKLSELITSCKDLPKLRMDSLGTKSDINEIFSTLGDNLKISKDIQTNMSNFLVTHKNHTATLNDILTKVNQSTAPNKPTVTQQLNPREWSQSRLYRDSPMYTSPFSFNSKK